MNTNEIRENGHGIAYQPLSVMVAAWDRDQVTPGSKHYLGVTITNRGTQDAVVQVRLDSTSPLLQQWCPQPEQWLALSSNKSGELTFCIEVPGDAVPQWLNYEVEVRPQGAYADYYMAPRRCRLQVLAPEPTETSQDPTFTLTPVTTPDRPLVVPPGNAVAVELRVENRSERVDRFRLECTGLPADWTVQVDYPQESTTLGLVRQEDSLGVNPGDRGTIRATLQPPPLPLAGSYLPTFRLASENDPNLGLLALMYLRVDPVYSLQSQLQVVQDQVRDRPAQFTVQFANLGNTPRQVTLDLVSLSPPATCVYQLPDTGITIAPQSVTQVPLEGKPQHWWTRPWFGAGKIYPFRLDLVDPESHPVNPPTLQGYLTWMPRPWWQLLLVVLASLGLVGALAFLIWWHFLRPPTPPEVLEFAAEDSRYAELNGDMARVRWQIARPDQIKTLKLTGYSPEGEILSGPLVYDFVDDRLPAALQPFCTLQKTLLSCTQIRSDAFQPGKYIFELTLVPRGSRTKPISLKTSPVEITAKPQPTVTTLLPKALVYREAAPGKPTPEEETLPVADAAGIRLDWVVTMPGDITALRLVGRDKEGKLIGDRWYEFEAPGEVPEELRAFCRVGLTLVCRNVPTGLKTIGEYRLELEVVSATAPTTGAKPGEKPEVKPKSTEVIKIQGKTPEILNFRVNGQESPAKLLIPAAPGDPPPVIPIQWRVQGGASTKVQLTPAPGDVSLVGELELPLSPQGGTTLVLQVKTPSGEMLTRSVTIEVYDPTAGKEDKETPGGGAPGGGAPGGAPGGGAPGASPPPPKFGAPTPAQDDRLSPSEQPPQF